MPSVTSEVDICNMALTRLGNSVEISSLDENSKAARLCKRSYALTRNAVLRAHPWNFAIRRASLAADAEAPIYEYSYQYTLPVDFLKIVQTDLESLQYIDIDYRIEGRKFLSNDSTVFIEYIAEVTDVTQYDPLFVDVLAQRLAAEIAAPLTENAQIMQAVWKVYETKLQEARSVDAQEGVPRDIQANQWLVSRL